MPKPSLWTGDEDQIAEAVRLWESGTTIREIARMFKTGMPKVADALRGAGLSVKRGRNKLPVARQRELIERRRAGATLAVLADEFSMSEGAISMLLARRGERTAKWGAWTPERYAELREMFDSGLSASEIGRRLGLTQASVSHRLRMTGVPPESARSGAQHGSWKGGRIVMAGYTYVRPMAEDLPYGTPNGSGYVAEHRLVMGKSIGRALRPSESVHHLNGERSDNRPENLQLRQGKHGSGVVMVCNACGSHDIVTRPIGLV